MSWEPPGHLSLVSHHGRGRRVELLDPRLLVLMTLCLVLLLLLLQSCQVLLCLNLCCYSSCSVVEALTRAGMHCSVTRHLSVHSGEHFR